MKIFFSFLFLIFLFGCATKEVKPYKPKPLPTWYLTPPKSDSKYVYVTGEGVNKKEAILNALSNFISRYSVTISSKFESKSQDFGGGIANKNAAYNIKAVVKSFEVSNYDIVKAEQYKFDEYLVLIRVDINKLYEDLKIKLDNRFENYKNSYQAILQKSLLEQFIYLKELLAKLKKEENYIYVLKLMNENFNEKKYFAFINEVEKKLEMLKNSLYVEIISNNISIKEDIKKYLIAKGIKVGNSKIKLVAKVEKKKSSMMNLVSYDVYINVKYKGDIIASNHFKIVVPQNTNINGYLYDEIKNLSLKDFLSLN